MMAASAALWRANTYEALIGAVGTGALGDVILRAADSLSGVDEMFGFWIDADGPPVQLTSSGHRGSAKARASLYAGLFHRLDPLLPIIRHVGGAGEVMHASVHASDIMDPIYRRECFDRPGLTEKIAFVRTCGMRQYVLSFYRTRDHRPAKMEELGTLAEMALPVLKRHGELLGDEAGLSLTERLELRLSRTCPELTGRERQVCARSLAGMTAEATALDLGIRETSVLTYRRRAYERYGISNVGQLLENLLR